MTDPVRAVIEPQDQPLRFDCAVIALKEGAHEITLTLDGKSVRIIAGNAVVMGSCLDPIARAGGQRERQRSQNARAVSVTLPSAAGI